MGIGSYSSRAERLEVVCDYYLGLGLREESGGRGIWPCPSCGEASFVARFEEGVVGCIEERCEVSPAMDLPEMVAYLDGGLEARDRRGANEKFGEIFEAAVRQEGEREEERKERRRHEREERRWQRGLARARARERGDLEEKLF